MKRLFAVLVAAIIITAGILPFSVYALGDEPQDGTPETPVAVYTVTYDSNSGEDKVDAPAPAETDAEGIVTVAKAIERPGYTFMQWNTEADGSGEAYNPGARITPEADMTLYAIWAEDIPAEKTAVIYLCSSGPNGHYLMGHVWICLKNTGSEPFDFAGCEVAPGKMISAGLHHGGGLFFNREMKHYAGKSVRCEKRELNEEGIARASAEASKSKWGRYELFTHNCSNFAAAVWRAATGENAFAFCFPFVVSIQMMAHGSERLTISSGNTADGYAADEPAYVKAAEAPAAPGAEPEADCAVPDEACEAPGEIIPGEPEPEPAPTIEPEPAPDPEPAAELTPEPLAEE